jgi:Spy/CpxP family protein refolding chaperone
MKRNLIILVFLFSFSLTFAQQNNEKRREDFEKFKAKRTEYISKEMNLTAEQSKSFWPVCDALQQKKFHLNRELREEMHRVFQKEKSGTKPTGEDYDKIIKLSAEVKVKEAELDVEYIEKFKAVISTEQIFKYQRAELHFARSFFDKDKPQQTRDSNKKIEKK